MGGVQHQFDILGLSPADAAHAGIAVAVARSGGIGLLDLGLYRDEATAERNFRQLCDATDARIGLRITGASVDLAMKLLSLVPERPLTLVFAGAAAEQVQTAERITPAAHHQVLAEVIDPAHAKSVGYPHAGIIAKGHEAGGWVGADTSYILAQKLLGKLDRPVYLQGGIGVHSAAGLRALGAAGVVLDDQLLLLAESPLPVVLQNELARLNGAETRLFGELLDSPSCRVYARPNAAALKAADDDARQADAGMLPLDQWRAKLTARMGWDAGVQTGETLLPLGQGIGVAATYRNHYRTVGRLVNAVRKASLKHIETAARLEFLAPGGPLAQSHGTRFPLCQGPMTRVSDNAEFAYQVSKNGGLPFLALALMRGDQVKELLEETRAKMGELPWGVGLLGFLPHSMLEEQCAAIWDCKPTYALLAGGRPDQAAKFESRGIPTYIHAPAPALLKMYIEQGAKRFVFEGRECGGHVGPLASFPLWEQMIELLLAEVKPGSEAEYHVLFAGGIHDARSGAMLAALTAPLAARGIRVGALMGTAYLFTKEIVNSGAVVEGFQEQALACERTVNLESGPGHATRCADTPFARDFYETRKRLLREGRSSDEIRLALEELNLGRLRIASKGVNRGAGGDMVKVDAAGQYAEGMYMIGQVATLHDRILPIEELHLDVTEGAATLLQQIIDEREDRALAAHPCDVAIIGIGTLLPQALDGEKFWENILNKTNVITEIPKHRFDSELYFDPDRRSRETIYSKWGGFLEEVPFNPISYGIPPKSMKSIDPMQLLALEVTRRALADAGLDQHDFDRENTSVILGAGGGAGELGAQYAVRSELPRWVENPSDDVWDRLPKWTAESFAGCLLNVVAGRIANRMDLGGLNFTVDAACASSLAAVAIATNELESGRSNVVVAGGVDTGQGPFGYLCFSKTQALSPTGRLRSFDVSADGIVISEGFVMVVLKRLADAERDGDRIYAVIKSVGGSSDGKAMGMTAPRPEGQMRALKRAYAKAGISPATIGLVEAHGTGTAVGDKAEAKTMTTVMLEGGAPAHTAAIGSVKSLIGHSKACAGVTGLVKAALSLHYRTLPGHYGVEKPVDLFAEPTSPMYLLKDARPWLAKTDYPRRAGVSAFGFGGTNFHAVLEEYRGSSHAAPGAERWPYELFVLRAADDAALATEVGRIATALHQGTNIKLRDLAFSLARQAETRRGGASLAIVAKDFPGLIADLEAALAVLQGKSEKPLPKNVHLGRGLKPQAPAVGFLFPGQGSQYVNMGNESALYIEELRSALELADATLRNEFPNGLSRLILPPATFDPADEKAQTAALTDTRVAQPAIGALSLGYMRLAEKLGLTAMAAAGHSYGEYAALCAAHVISPTDFLHLSAVRGRCMAEAAKTSQPGAMAAIQAKREVVAKAIEGLAGVRIANHNAPEQSVISGPAAQVEDAAKKLEATGARVTRLPVSGAFHTELVAGAQEGLSSAIRSTPLGKPRFTVYSNTTGAAYPTDPQGIGRVLEGHLLNSVEFVTEIEAMYAAGCRVFVELGPKGTCSNMAKQILAGRDAITVSLDGSGGGLRGLLLGLAELSAAGVDLALTRLFEGRDAKILELNRLAELVKPVEYSKSTWWVSGGCARPFDDPIMRNGPLPQLDAKAVEAARAKAEEDKRTVEEAKRILASPPAPVQVPVPAAASMQPATPMGPVGAWNGEALAAYQQTMRQFLSLQERVIQQFLGTPGAAAGMPAMPVMPMPSAPAIPAMIATTAPSPAPAAAAPAPVPAAQPKPASPAIPAAAPIAAAAKVVATAATSAIDVKASLMEIVAERTGYPQDMLGLDQDMEAELGIDSIKRVEILGTLQKLLPAAVGESMQGSMEKYIQAKTLRAIIDLAQADLTQFGGAATSVAAAPAAAPMATAPAAAPVAAAPAVAVAAAPMTLDRPALQTQLLAIVSERTGYPSEMLGLDQDMEAELGIDSIKRVEILGALQKVVPESLGAAMQASMEQFIGARSLNAVLDVALSVAAAAPPSAAAAPQSTTVAAAPAPATVAAPAAAPAIVTATAAVVSAPIALDRAGLKDQLLGIVAERTGYPTDMLGMDQDLEAELGIDSIKRVEILGALQKVVPESLGAAMQASMEQFIGARSLNAVLDVALSVAAAAPAAAPGASPMPTPVAPAAAQPAAVAATPAAPTAATTAPATASEPIVLDRTALKDQLLAIVAERTGYPTDMLGMDQDLEAELGIDSIKRVEILGALQKVVPESLGAAMQASMEQFIGARSLNAVLEVASTVAANAGKPAAAEPAPVATAPAAAAVAAAPAENPAAAPEVPTEAVQRLVVRMRPAPLPATRQSVSGLYVITADNEGVAQRVADRIVGAGGFAAVVPIDIASDPAAIKDTVARLRAQHGAVRGIVHLPSLEGADTSNINAWHQASRSQVKALFFLLQQAAADFAAGDAVALSASRFGGSLGREAHGRSVPTAGGAVGLFNCAIAEWPKLRARLVDFEDSASPDFVADALLDELMVVDRRPEVGYRGTERVSGGYVIEPLVDHPFAPHLEPAGDWVMLVTGGARGITAEVAEELVRPGMRLVLVGRTPMPAPESAATASLTDTAALKKGLLQTALSAGRKPTPKEIDGEVKAVLANREIRMNTARLSARGAIVDYRACDVRDAETFGALIDGIYAQYGRIDAVLHGAGMIEDKRIADKTPESFDRVYDTKADSAFVMARKLKPEGLKLLAFFTSVAGRFGNVGQGDYGAANETLNRFAWQLHHAWPRVRVVSINWGPWDAGMATDAMRTAFKSIGIVPVSIPGGRRFFLDELALGGRNDVELVAGAGPWTQFAEAATSAPTVPAVAPKQANSLTLPLIHKPIRIGVGGAVVLEHRLSLVDDPYLADHIVDGKPVLPATVAVEYIAQFVAAGYPEWQISEIRDVRQLAGIVLEGETSRDIMLRARSSSHSDAGMQAVTVEIVDPLRKFVPFYRATVVLSQRLPDAPLAMDMLPLGDGEPMDWQTAYVDLLFHGDRFRLISKFSKLSSGGADAEVMPSSPESFLGAQFKGSRWLFDPGLLDAAPQLVHLCAITLRDKGALPSRFGKITRYGSEPLIGPLKLVLREKPAPHEHAIFYDAQIIDQAGRVRLAITDGESTMSATLKRLAPKFSQIATGSTA